MKPASMQSLSDHFFAQVPQPDIGCWLWPGSITINGYGRLQFHGQTFMAHRAAYELAYGPIPRGTLVCHHCDEPRCVRPDHLFLGSSAENQADMTRKNRGRVGERNGHAILTAEEVTAIRQRYAEGGITQQRLGYMFGVSQLTVSDIVTRKSWKHLP
jgi:hypothetical protein